MADESALQPALEPVERPLALMYAESESLYAIAPY
jgi:hypothetical protein